MNAFVTFRANGIGNLNPTRVQRQAAQQDVAANFIAKLRQTTQKSVPTTATASSEGIAKSNKTAESGTASQVVGQQELSKDSFLQLLVLELQNQDPTEPVSNTDMLAQLAQFSALEASTNLNESFEELAQNFEFLTGNVDQLNFISAQGLLGKQVQGINVDGNAMEGTVESVHLDGSIVVLTVNGELMPMTGVLSVGSIAKKG
jgi:flagellar basal-body rod modification protein FlgD